MDNLNAVLDIEIGCNDENCLNCHIKRVMSKRILQAVIDDLKARNDELEEQYQRFDKANDVKGMDLTDRRQLENKLTIKKLQAVMRRLS